jgi:hypothetical protein
VRAPCGKGDFVDCFYPFAERPRVPGPIRHIVYVQTLAKLRDDSLRAVVMFTTTSPRMIEGIPVGLSIAIPPAASVSMGMRNGFTIDIHRMALLPLEADWFPDVNSPGFVLGHADDHLQRAITKRYDDMRRREPSPALVMGPPISKPRP